MGSNRSSDADTQRHCAASHALEHTSCGAASMGAATFDASAGVAELKRTFAVPNAMSVGSAVLAFLECEASRFGHEQAKLETRRVNQRAVSFYGRHDYRPITNFGRYVGGPEAICFCKRLPSAPSLATGPQQPVAER